MIFELVGSRVLGPYFWTSVFVWTSLIGVILWSLSIWYFLWWKIADKKVSFETLSFILFISAIFISLMIFLKWILLNFLQDNIIDIKTSSIIASIILFSPTSILLWMVSPYAVKLKLNDLNNSWSIVWNLYAISTTWSIFWTFLSWFYLIPFLGTNKLLFILSIILIINSVLIFPKKKLIFKLFTIFLIFINLFLFNEFNNKIIDVDTVYNRIWIYDYFNTKEDKLARIMWINNENHSSMFLNSDELVNEYTKYYHLAKHFNPDFKTTLMFWWAWYSFPKDFLNKYPKATIDVVEIDPKITELAKKYFNLKDNPNLNIFHEDWRVFLNKTQNKYDVIFWDAFSSHYSIPYQLTTKEAIQKKYNILNEDWIVILNIISSLEWEKNDFLRAEYKTYKSIFPQVFLFPVSNPYNSDKVQNIILVALKSNKNYNFSSKYTTLNEFLKHLRKNEIDTNIPILTDDFAPVDYYINKNI